MIKRIQLGFALMLAITFFAFGSIAFAQTDASNTLQATSETAISADYDVSVQPVKFFDKVKLFFTFNAEKKAELLSDFSKRNFVLATQNFEQGNTAQAEVLLQKSEMDMARANIAATKIIQPEKREQAMNRMSSETSMRAAVLTEVQSRLENPAAQEALGRAIARQQIAPDLNANQNAGTRGNNGTALGGGIGISAVNPACTPTTTPYIKVLSPNGGEEYSNTDELEVEWESCNIASSTTLAVELLHNTDGIMVAFVPNTGSHTFQLSPASLMNPPVSPSQPVTYGQYFKAYVGTPPTIFPSYQDWSDNFFKIAEGSSVPGVSVPANLGVSTSQNYVKLVSGGGPNAPHQAVFEFLTPVQTSDINASNIIYCVRSASVGAENAGYSNENCNPLPAAGAQWGQVISASSANGFALNYNPSNLSLTISDVDQSDTNGGSFFVGCASCTANIKFTGIRNQSNVVLPNKVIQVY